MKKAPRRPPPNPRTIEQRELSTLQRERLRRGCSAYRKGVDDLRAARKLN